MNTACTRKKDQVARNTLPVRLTTHTNADTLNADRPRSISAGNIPE